MAFSAVLSGVKEVREVAARRPSERGGATGRRTILFVDEIHRFNKAQQDAFLPHVETGDIVLIGATTENPSFEVNARAAVALARRACSSRSSDEQLSRSCSARARRRERGLGALACDGRGGRPRLLAARADGDARGALERARAGRRVGRARRGRRRVVDHAAMEQACAPQDAALRPRGRGALQPHLGAPQVAARLRPRRRALLAGAHARGGRGSALHRAPPGALRLRGRRATPTRAALELAVAAQKAVHFIGLPEGELALAQAAVYLAVAPKSNAFYVAYSRARGRARRAGRAARAA